MEHTFVSILLYTDINIYIYIIGRALNNWRRGRCSDVYCDNGTSGSWNACGGKSMSKKWYLESIFSWKWYQDSHFAPPGSPHFNGPAEAGVNIAKSALKRAIGEPQINIWGDEHVVGPDWNSYEFKTNRRTYKGSKRHYTALTPGHLLIGQPLTAQPEPNVLQLADDRLSRWKLITKMLQQFWTQWQRDYLHQRGKWAQLTRPIKVDDIVVLREENLPPTKWLLGREIALHPGDDGNVRMGDY